jgi:predicted  nucleic acid-binding Zn-ribbon protein
MAEDTETTEAAEHDGTDEQRLTRLETGLDELKGMVARLLPTHAEAEQHTEKRLDRGSAVEDEAKAAVQQALADQKRQEAAEAAQSEQASMREQLAKLAEKPPESPVSIFERSLGWKRHV